MYISTKKVALFQEKVFSYFEKEKRTLPWRETVDPYRILVSEFMLQQTQVHRVLPFYRSWTTRWDTLEKFALSSRKEVLKEWMGLGYNNRAINLQKSAQKILDMFQGDVIEGVKNYEELPGVGPYTSSAVRIFSLNEDIATVDTNIRRIFIYEFTLPQDISASNLQKIAEKCLPKGRSRDWHNALMDYGSSVLTAKKSGVKSKTLQSKFEGSDRQARAKILRFYLSKGSRESYTFTELKQETGVDDRERVHKILQGMILDSLLLFKGKRYFIENGRG